MSIIELENVNHRFPDGTAGLQHINLSIMEGTLSVVAGQNGSGKTTFLKHLNGLLLPTTGTVWIAGEPVSKDIHRARQLVGMVFQDADSQIIGETVEADVAFGPENLCLEPNDVKKRVAAALAAVGLTKLATQRPHLPAMRWSAQPHWCR